MPTKVAYVARTSSSRIAGSSDEQHHAGHVEQMTASRPELEHFDSLQCLLEQAGYKETRIFTPIHTKAPASPPETSKGQSSSAHSIEPSARESKRDVKHNDDIKAIASRSSWFHASWKAGKPASTQTSEATAKLRKKQSEPVMSKRRTQDSWTSSWWRVGPTEEAVKIDVHTKEDLASSSAPVVRPQLRHAPSTHSLWQASMRHHRAQPSEPGSANRVVSRSRSFPARPNREPDHQATATTSAATASLRQKQSYDGARVVVGVGVLATMGSVGCRPSDVLLRKGTHRMSLRDAFLRDDEEQAVSDSTTESSAITSRKESWDSVSSLDELVGMKDDRSNEASQFTDVGGGPTDLFARAAAPLLSRQDAVAMRNTACLDLSGISTGITSPPSAIRLRRMRSVDALELALSRMQAGGASFITSTAPIPESASAESLTADDFAHAKTTHNDLDLEDSPVRPGRCPTPTLVITSPTGERPPQPLLLEGVEFEPQSVSPKRMTKANDLHRPTPRRSGWKVSRSVVTTEAANQRRRGRQADSVAKTIAERRSLDDLSRSVHVNPEPEHLRPPRLRKRSTTKSNQDLRRAAATQAAEQAPIRASIGKLSGSEQVRALHRSIQLRDQSAARTGTSSTTAGASAQSHPIPRSPDEPDGDDPFSDFVALTNPKSTHASSRRQNVDIVRVSPKIDRSSISTAPFERSTRSPLTETRSGADNATTEGSRRPLARKRSGVGLACLVEVDRSPRQAVVRTRHRRNTSATSSSSSTSSDKVLTYKLKNTEAVQGGINDENTFPLLDSPTAHAVRRINRRNSRPRS